MAQLDVRPQVNGFTDTFVKLRCHAGFPTRSRAGTRRKTFARCGKKCTGSPLLHATLTFFRFLVEFMKNPYATALVFASPAGLTWLMQQFPSVLSRFTAARTGIQGLHLTASISEKRRIADESLGCPCCR